MRRALAALIVALVARSAHAAPAFTEGGAVEAARVVDGATLLLKDERVLRLVDIDVPSRGARAAEAKEALAALIERQALSVKFAGTATDLTELESARSEIAGSRARLAVVGEALRVHALTTALEPDGGVVAVGDVRPAIEAVLGPLEPGVEPHAAWVDAILDEDRGVIADFATALRTGRPFDQVYRVRARDGAVRTVRSLAKGRHRPDGAIIADGVIVELD